MQQALEHREAALKLAEHWKEEAIKQARFAQVSTCACAPLLISCSFSVTCLSGVSSTLPCSPWHGVLQLYLTMPGAQQDVDKACELHGRHSKSPP